MGTPVNSVAFFGPSGTFTEEALLSQGDLARQTLLAKPSIADVLEAVAHGEVDLGFVPLENAIEGTVNETLDALIFDYDFSIEREVVLDVHLQLMAKPGATIPRITRIHSYPHALAQVRGFLASSFDRIETIAEKSTADAARVVSEQGDLHDAAIAPRLSASLYGLDILAENIEDHPDNQTRFVALTLQPSTVRTGSDRTSIVCFQDADRPGSLYEILGEFASRSINLTNLQSRPTKQGLGDYCFVIDLEGHRDDEPVRECLAALQQHVAAVKILGSYAKGNVLPG